MENNTKLEFKMPQLSRNKLIFKMVLVNIFCLVAGIISVVAYISNKDFVFLLCALISLLIIVFFSRNVILNSQVIFVQATVLEVRYLFLENKNFKKDLSECINYFVFDPMLTTWYHPRQGLGFEGVLLVFANNQQLKIVTQYEPGKIQKLVDILKDMRIPELEKERGFILAAD